LLFYLPFRYQDYSSTKNIADLEVGEEVTIKAKIEIISNRRIFKRRTIMTEAIVYDETGKLKIVWFGQPFITRNFKPGDTVYLSGKLSIGKLGKQMASPSYEKETKQKALGEKNTTHTARIVPIYHLTTGVTNKQLRFLVSQIIYLTHDLLKEWIPDEILEKADLIYLAEAVRGIHFPIDEIDLNQAKKRLKFGELFILQLRAEMIRQSLKRSKAWEIKFQQEKIKEFVSSLPFQLTKAQKVSAWDILRDLEKNEPMNRLLEGDVGSGKTVVAAMALYNTVLNNYQAVIMAPTEILAVQHFDSLTKLLEDKVKIALLTRSQSVISDHRSSSILIKKDLLKQIKTGQINLIIGTHALLSEKVQFKNLGLVIIDEQHRFGVEQRRRLTQTYADDAEEEEQQEKESKSGFLYKDLTYKIRGCIFNVKKNLGLGHKEVIYQNALEEEFKKEGIKFEKEKVLDIKYENKKIGIYRPDFVVEDKIIIELKALPFVGSRENRQVWTYLKGSLYKLALLINFSHESVDIQRIVYDIARGNNESASSLRQSAMRPHLLSMTATPIPRSFALTLYGDLDLSIINEMPVGRKAIDTRVVDSENRNKAYDFIRSQVKQGRQVFVICPLIDEGKRKKEKGKSDDDFVDNNSLLLIPYSLDKKSVMSEYKKLSEEIFKDLRVGYLHGKLKPNEKENTMADFASGKIDILVSTSVVEVGVNIPNAVVMMIEGADRFGLAQLHQFRGRVGRALHQSYCFLFTDTDNEKSLARLQFFSQNTDGFKIAEYDLQTRGPGEVYGTSQSGLPPFKLATMQDMDLIKLSRDLARGIDFKKNPSLVSKVRDWEDGVHLE